MTSFALISLAILIKYSALPFLGAMILTIIIRKEYKNLVYILTPISILALWSGWNYIEYGHLHLLDRPRNAINLIKIPEFLCCLGAILFVTPFRGKKTAAIYYPMIVLLILTGFIIYQLESIYLSIFLQTFFLLNGILLLTIPIIKSTPIRIIENQFIIISIYTISCFIVFFAPFIATRHILLITPFLLLLIHTQNISLSTRTKTLGLTITTILCFALSTADFNYAGFYKQQSKEISKNFKGKKYTIGYWGWQWYARQNGINIYDKASDSLQINDIMIVPKDIAKQGIAENIEMTLIQKIVPNKNSTNPFSVSNHGSFYNSFIDRPVWTFSSQPLDTLCVYKVTKVIK